MLKGQKYRLYLTEPQEAFAKQTAAACRAVYNAALEQRQTAYKQSGVSVSWAQQCAEIKEVRAEFDWVGAAPVDCLHQSVRDLDKAYKAFFARRAGYPRFRRKGRHESFRCRNSRGSLRVRRLSRRWGEVILPKIGWVRFRMDRPLDGELKYATVYHDGLGWQIAFCVEDGRAAAAANGGPPIGVDRGVAVSFALSDGRSFSVPDPPPGQARLLARLERRAGRQETARRHRPPSERKRSNRHQRTYTAIASLRAKRARIRQDFIHNLTHNLSKSHGTVVIEDLNTRGMTASARGTLETPGINVRAKAGLNRLILHQGWHEFERQLNYKCEWYGSELARVPAPFTSQTCSSCGHIDAASRPAQAQFACTNCGHRENADVNAAKVILKSAEKTGATDVLAARGALGIVRAVKREPALGAA